MNDWYGPIGFGANRTLEGSKAGRLSGRGAADAKVKEAEQILAGQPGGEGGVMIVDQVAKKFPFFLENGRDSLLDRARREHSLDIYPIFLANPMGAVDRLVFDRRVPPPVEKDDVVGELQVQPDGAGAVTE